MSEPIYAADRFARVEVDPLTDRARFEQMLDRHHRRLRKVVAGVIADPIASTTSCKRAYYNAYRKLPRAFANEAHESTWLYRVVYRCCLNELRSRRRRPEAAVGEGRARRGAEPDAFTPRSRLLNSRRNSSFDRSTMCWNCVKTLASIRCLV